MTKKSRHTRAPTDSFYQSEFTLGAHPFGPHAPGHRTGYNRLMAFDISDCIGGVHPYWSWLSGLMYTMRWTDLGFPLILIPSLFCVCIYIYIRVIVFAYKII